jgi:hypothetical protein
VDIHLANITFNTGDYKDELRLIRQFKQEKTIKIAILDKLDGILKEKIMMLRKETNKDNR